MMRFAKLILIGFLTILSLTVPATAQSLIPDFRYFATRDTDFYGADLDNLFDTDLPSCVRACSANTECSAFTFNTRSNACFPKRGVTERSAFAGAFSAVKLITSPSVVRAGETRRAALDFLGEEDLDRAQLQGRELGLGHASNGEDLETMLSNARDRRAQGDTVQAMAWTGAALALPYRHFEPCRPSSETVQILQADSTSEILHQIRQFVVKKWKRLIDKHKQKITTN